MKKRIALLLIALLTLVLLTACSGGPSLRRLELDGGCSLDFDRDTHAYTVLLPAGRPRIPRISAKGSGEISVVQATIPDSAEEGTATVTVEKNGKRVSYSVTFQKSPEMGFELQFEDRWTFAPACELKNGEAFRFESSDPSVLAVDESGLITALKRSEEPVTVSAFVGDLPVDSLTVDRVIRAPLNVFLIIGQSNAYGYYDLPSNYDSFEAYAAIEVQNCDRPEPGTVYCDDIETAFDDTWFSGFYDLSRGRRGFSPALGKEWYALTGEKTFMLQTAVGGSPIQTWVADPELRYQGIDCYAVTLERFRLYRDWFSSPDSDFELNRIYAFWLEGETHEEKVYVPDEFTWVFKNDILNYKYSGDWVNLDFDNKLMESDEYYNYFVSMYRSLVKDVGLEFMAVLPVRAMSNFSCRENRESQRLVDVTAIRAAQFALNYTENGKISFVTLKTEIGRTDSYPDQSAEGWGYLGFRNVHYTQLGYNVLGKDAADNLYVMLTDAGEAEEIEILDTNGTTLLNGAEIGVPAGGSRQITAIALPITAEDSCLSFSVSDPAVCAVDAYGMIRVPETAAAGSSAVIGVTNGSLSEEFTLTVE